MTYADRVKDTSTTTGTGNFTLSGSPPTGYQAISALGGVGITFPYVIDGGAQWEVGEGTITATNQFSRSPTASSNSGSLVSFSAGTKSVFCAMPASRLRKLMAANTASFSTAIALNAPGTTSMPQQSVASVLAFTVAAGPVQDALVHVRLIADGTNAPTFSGMREWSGSSGWVNTANILNIVQFWCDGTDVWYSIAQDANGAVEPTPATTVTMTGPTSVVVNVASSNYTVGTDGTRPSSVLVTPTPVTNVTFTPSSVTLSAGTSTGTFTATSTTTGAKTIAVTNDGGLTNPSNITLTVNASATAPDAPTIGTATAGDASLSVTFTAPASDGGSAITGYTASVYKVSDDTLVTTSSGSASPVSVTGLSNAGVAVYAKVAATNAVGTGSQSAASNSVTPAASGAVFRFASLSGMTESGTSPNYVYTSTSSSFSGCSSVGNLHRAASTDGSLAITHPVLGTNNATMLCLKTTSTTGQSFSDTKYGFYAAEDVGFYRYLTNGGSITASSVVPEAGDIMRLRVTGTSVVAEVARAGSPTTFIEVHTWTGDDGSALYYLLQLVNGGVVTNYIDTCTAVSLV